MSETLRSTSPGPLDDTVERILLVENEIGVLGDRGVDHLEDHLLEVLPGEHLAAPRVEDLALIIHDLVVFEQALADLEVAFLDLLLGLLNALADPLVIDGLAFLPADPGKGLDRPLGGEDAHQVVVEAQEELAGAVVALASGAAAQLVVDAPGLVALGAQDVQAPDLGDALAKLDIRAATGHVRGDRHVSAELAVAALVLLPGLEHSSRC